MIYSQPIAAGVSGLTQVGNELIPSQPGTSLGDINDPFKNLYLEGNSLYLGTHTLIEEIAEDDSGLATEGSIHIEAYPDGKAGNICLQEGTEPIASATGDHHRIWVDDVNHNIMWQNHLGESSIIHTAGGVAPGQWILTGTDISYSAGDVTIDQLLTIKYASSSDRGIIVEANEGDRAYLYWDANSGIIFDSYRPSDERRLPILLQPNGGKVGVGKVPVVDFDVDGVIQATQLGVGTPTIPHGGIGMAKFTIEGANTNINGPHIQYTTDADDYPLFQQMNWRHDDIELVFDAYYDGAWKSSDVGSNFRIMKNGDRFRLQYDSGVAQGGAVTWNNGITLDATGKVSLYGELDIGANILTVNSVEVIGADGQVNKAAVESSDDWDTAYILAQNVQNTGLVEGGLITAASSTTVNITSGNGNIADYSDPSNPVTIQVPFNALSGYTPVNLATDGTFVMGINSSGNVIEINASALSNQDRRDNILIGALSFTGGTIIDIQTSPLNLGYDGIVSAKDFIRDVIGPSNVIGNIMAANGVNLSIDNSGGSVFVLASNYRNNAELPDQLAISTATPMIFLRVFRAAAPTIITDGAGPVNVLDPSVYDDGSGTLQTVSSNDYTVQVVYITPGGGYLVAYGQEVFGSMSDAEIAIANGSLQYDEFPTLQLAVRRAFIIVGNDATDLSDADQAKFFADGKFRGGGVSTSGGIAGINVPGGSNGSVQYNDNGAFGGDGDLIWDNINKWLGVGTSPLYPLHVKDIDTETRLILESGRSFVYSGDVLGSLNFVSGLDSHDFIAKITATALASWEFGSYPARLNFFTVPSGSVNPQLQAIIDENGLHIPPTSGDGLIIGLNPDGSGRIEMKDDEKLSIYSPLSVEVMRFGRGPTTGQILIGNIAGNEAVIVGDLYTGGYAGIQHKDSSASMIVQNGNGRTIISYNSSQYLDIQTDNLNSVARFTGGGRVGIGGITDPTDILEAKGNIRASGPNRFVADNDVAYIYVGDENHYLKAVRGDLATLHTYHGLHISDDTAGIFATFKDGFGGVGTINPGLPWDVRSADDNQIIAFDTTAQAQGTGGGYAFGGYHTDAGAEAMAGRIGVKKTNSISGDYGFGMVLQTQTNGGSITDRIEILSNGYVGVDITPTMKFDVNGTARIRGDITVDNDVIVGGDITVDNDVIVTNDVKITGKLGAGKAIPGYAVDVYTNWVSGVEYSARFVTDGNVTAARGLFVQAGEDDETGTNRWFDAWDGDGDTLTGYLGSVAGVFALFDVSDRRLKMNIKDTRINAGKIINNVRVVDFEWRKNPGRQITGIIAQEVKNIYPDAVSADPDTGMYSLSKAALIPPLVKYVQELEKRITALEVNASRSKLQGVKDLWSKLSS